VLAVIWVYGPGDDGVMVFINFGIKTLIGIVNVQQVVVDATRADTAEGTKLLEQHVVRKY